VPAIDTFDWFKNQVCQRMSGHPLKIRNENERRRFIENLMKDVKLALTRK
jgi:hypothetical protein